MEWVESLTFRHFLYTFLQLKLDIYLFIGTHLGFLSWWSLLKCISIRLSQSNLCCTDYWHLSLCSCRCLPLLLIKLWCRKKSLLETTYFDILLEVSIWYLFKVVFCHNSSGQRLCFVVLNQCLGDLTGGYLVSRSILHCYLLMTNQPRSIFTIRLAQPCLIILTNFQCYCKVCLVNFWMTSTVKHWILYRVHGSRSSYLCMVLQRSWVAWTLYNHGLLNCKSLFTLVEGTSLNLLCILVNLHLAVIPML